ncbi:DUF2281 domain-containing protein [Treponema pectinovorum]|uniref:DUF2281 domain-containing protein n=1 Tax=Treponema pectinovorum TaxID=164 RepID=UPI00164D7199|nr:DUF2281 domain-containing protein [Treponema pectinovorum]
MPYDTLEKKIELLPAQYQQEVIDFIDFLLTRPHPAKKSIDVAIEELKNGEYDTYSSFDDFLQEIEK